MSNQILSEGNECMTTKDGSTETKSNESFHIFSDNDDDDDETHDESVKSCFSMSDSSTHAAGEDKFSNKLKDITPIIAKVMQNNQTTVGKGMENKLEQQQNNLERTIENDDAHSVETENSLKPELKSTELYEDQEEKYEEEQALEEIKVKKDIEQPKRTVGRPPKKRKGRPPKKATNVGISVIRGKRGRPRKKKLPEEEKSEDSYDEGSVYETMEETHVKRSVGRPRKRKIQNFVSEDLAPRRKGRPRKYKSEDDVSPPTKSVGRPRKKGRPKKLRPETDTTEFDGPKRTSGRPRKLKSLIEELESTSKDLDEMNAKEDTFDKNEKAQKKPRYERRQCPICKLYFHQNGLFMHVTKCKKFKDWSCDWCGTGILSFAPKGAVAGPNGNYSLCPDCGQNFKNQNGPKLGTTKKKELPNRKHPKRTRKPILRLDQDPDSKESSDYKSDSDSSVSSTSSRQSIDKENIEASKDKNWIVYYDCLILLAAMNDPTSFTEKGPGIWMLASEEKDGKLLKNMFSDSFIVEKWNNAMYGDSCSELFESDILKQILSFCIAKSTENVGGKEIESEPMKSKSLCLLASNWKFSPVQSKFNLTGNRKKDNIFSDWRWVKPSLSITSNNHVSLKEAWAQHSKALSEIVEDVAKKYIPKSIILPRKDKETESVQIKPRKRTFNKNQKKLFVMDGDPRPFANCSWCGPKLKETPINQNSSQKNVATRPACDACKYLEGEGWKLKVYQRKPKEKFAHRAHTLDYRYTDPDHKAYRSMKAFLLNTTESVVAWLTNEKIEANNDSDSLNKIQVDDDSDFEEIPVVPRASVTIEESRTLRLPTLAEILEEEEGLGGILKEDEFRVLRSKYGSCMDIAFQVLQCLCKGRLPQMVQFETPFLRPMDDLNFCSRSGGAPPTRFIGVKRIFRDNQGSTNLNAQPDGKFGVEFPAFSPYDSSSTPLCASSENKMVLLRADLDREDVAGQLYSFVYRILYGLEATEKFRKKCNSSHVSHSFLKESLFQLNYRERDKTKIEEETPQ